MERNEPLLADVRAPWDPWDPIGRRKPRDIWARILYVRRHGVFWAPTWMDSRSYNCLLQDLDRVCLKTLKRHGALTAHELAGRLNRKKTLRTKPKKTGVHEVTALTALSWLEVASRRGLVTAWPSTTRHSHCRRVRWELTNQGREALHSKAWIFFKRLSRWFSKLLLPPLIVSGLLIGGIEWLSLHPDFLLLTGLAVFSAVLLVVPLGITIWSEKREAPGVAVVAIETVRSAGKPIPAL